MAKPKKETRIKTSFSARVDVEMVFDQPIPVEQAREMYIHDEVDADNIVLEEVVGIGY